MKKTTTLETGVSIRSGRHLRGQRKSRREKTNSKLARTKTSTRGRLSRVTEDTKHHAGPASSQLIVIRARGRTVNGSFSTTDGIYTTTPSQAISRINSPGRLVNGENISHDQEPAQKITIRITAVLCLTVIISKKWD